MGNFNLITLPMKDLVLIEPKIFEDIRGFFMESYNKKSFENMGLNAQFVQDNHSKSSRGVLRGLHFQSKHPQGKLVRVVAGSVYDVAVDLRMYSPDFGKWFGIILSSENARMMYIPEGFAHGFLTLEDETTFLYKTTDYYYKEYDSGIRYDDPELNIDWFKYLNRTEIVVSEKDLNLQLFCRNKDYFGGD